MAEENVVKEEKKSSNTVLIVILIILILLLIGVVLFFALRNDNSDVPVAEAETSVNLFTLPYEAGAVIMDQDAMDEQVDALNKKAENGIGLKFKRVAVSEDGENFECSIGNAARNSYDMYIDIYKDESLEEELYVSGLLPPGASIYKFTTNQKLDPGDYEAVLVLTQVEDDHATLHAQTMVYLTLMVD